MPARKPNEHDRRTSVQNDDPDARLNEPYGPGQYRSGVDRPGQPTSKNPGHTSPAHNTPGHERADPPDRAVSSEQKQPSNYPGIMGPKARALKENTKPPTGPRTENKDFRKRKPSGER